MTVPGRTSQLRSTVDACRLFSQPASWAVWIADMTSPAATSTSAAPVNLKNFARLSRKPPL